MDIDEPQFAELCSALYEAAQTPELMTSALEQVRGTFGFEAFHQFVIDTHTGLPVQECASQCTTQDDMAQYAQYYFAKDLRPLMAAKAGVGRLFNTRDVFDKRTGSQSEIFQGFLYPRGVDHCLGGQLMASENLVGYVAFLDAANRKAESFLRQRAILKMSRSNLGVCEPNSENQWMGLLQRVRVTGLSESMTMT